MQSSEQINEVAKALAEAQAQMDHAAKARQNPAFKSRYADLASVMDACRPQLAAHQIAIVQTPAITMDPPTVTVDTRLVHASGQWIGCTLSALVKDAGPQTIGGAITYLRRYGLSSIAGIAPDDDDGNSSQPPQRYDRQERAPQPSAPANGNPKTTPQAAFAAVTSAYPSTATEARAIVDGPGDDEAKLLALRAIYQRETNAAKASKAQPRTAAEAKLVERARNLVAAIERDTDAGEQARQLVAEYGGLDAVGANDLGPLVSQLEGLYNHHTEAA